MKFWILLLAVGCTPLPPPDPTPDPKPTVVIDTPSVWTCRSACEHQNTLGCDVGKPTENGAPCEEVCEASFTAGVEGLQWDVEGLSQSADCR